MKKVDNCSSKSKRHAGTDLIPSDIAKKYRQDINHRLKTETRRWHATCLRRGFYGAGVFSVHVKLYDTVHNKTPQRILSPALLPGLEILKG